MPVTPRNAESKAAELGMWIASSLEKVDEESLRRLLGAEAEARIYNLGDGLHQVELIYPPGSGRAALVVILVEQPGWVSPVTYLGHSIQDMEAFKNLYEALEEDMERWRAAQRA